VAYQKSREDILGICEVKIDCRRQPALVIRPHKLPDPVDDVVNRVKRRRPVHLRFEPLPETFDGGCTLEEGMAKVLIPC
jgi:hypothetical protein